MDFSGGANRRSGFHSKPSAMALCRSGRRLAWAVQAVAAFLSVPPLRRSGQSWTVTDGCVCERDTRPRQDCGAGGGAREGGARPEREIKTLPVLDGEKGGGAGDGRMNSLQSCCATTVVTVL